jgi:hypothetical protein
VGDAALLRDTCILLKEQQLEITICEVRSSKDRRHYIKLPYELHKNNELWVPPLYIREKKYINHKKNIHMGYSRIICFIALREKIPVGRIMGIINYRLNESEGDNQARFCSFESIDDQEVAHKLLGAVEGWAKKQNMNRIVGPLGFSNQDPLGFLIEGFNERPSIGTIYNFEYILRLIEKEGYTKEVDYVTYKIPVPDTVPPLYYRISDRVKKRIGVKLLEFRRTKAVKPYLSVLFRFMNETYKDLYGFMPLSEEVISKTARLYSAIIDPNFIKIITDQENEIVAFVLGIKDITDGFRRVRGRLFPFGYFIIKAMQKKARRVDLLLGAVKKEYRRKGLDTIMAIAMIESAKKLGIDYFDGHNMLESNVMVHAEMEKLNGRVYKRHRVYQKEL